MTLLTCLAMFFASLAIDFVCVRWVSNVTARNPTQAMLYSVLCTILNQTTTIFCIYNYWLLIPLCIGHALGTGLAILYEEKSLHRNAPQADR